MTDSSPVTRYTGAAVGGGRWTAGAGFPLSGLTQPAARKTSPIAAALLLNPIPAPFSRQIVGVAPRRPVRRDSECPACETTCRRRTIDRLPKRRLGAALPNSAKDLFVTDTRLDVLCIGNAIVDVIAAADDAFLEQEGLAKGSMRLIDAEEATRLYGQMGPGREISGGCGGQNAGGGGGVRGGGWGGGWRLAAPRRATPRRACRCSAAAPASSARSPTTSSARSIATTSPR